MLTELAALGEVGLGDLISCASVDARSGVDGIMVDVGDTEENLLRSPVRRLILCRLLLFRSTGSRVTIRGLGVGIRPTSMLSLKDTVQSQEVVGVRDVGRVIVDVIA